MTPALAPRPDVIAESGDVWCTERDMRECAAGLGDVVKSITTPEGRPCIVVRMRGDVVTAAWNAAVFLGRLADVDAQDPEILECAQAIRAEWPSDLECAAACHAFVQQAVMFVREPGERFVSARETLRSGQGDCDDSARLCYALARACGLKARLAFLVVLEQPAHVFCEIGADGAYFPAEATIDAAFGEHPIDAGRRLGVRMRPDLSGKTVHLSGLGDVHMGSLGDSVIIDPNTFGVRNGTRLRLIAEVSMLAGPSNIAQGFADVGFSGPDGSGQPSVSLDESKLDPGEWPADWLGDNDTSPATLGRQLAFIDGVYTGSVSALNRTLDFAFIRDARVVLAAGQAPTAPAPPPAISPPPGNPAKPLTAADLPAMPPDPVDTTSERSHWAAAALKRAWFAVFGSDPSAPYSDAVEQGMLALAAAETDLGRSMWGDPFDVAGYSLRYNFGNVHCVPAAIPGSQACPPGCKKHGDTTNAGVAYTVCFQAFKRAEDGMAAMLRSSASHEDVREALVTGDADKIASAIAGHGYWGFDIDQKGIDLRAKAIGDWAKVIAGKLAKPQAVARGGVSGASGWLGGLAVIGLIAGTIAAGVHFSKG